MRLLHEQDAETLFATIDKNRAHLRPWLPWVDKSISAEQTREFIRNSCDQYGIFVDGDLAGAIGLHKIDAANRNTSIGYWLEAGKQGRGVMTRACRAVVTYAFEQRRLHRIEIRCATGNVRSCAIPQRLGFTREGVIREAEWVNDGFLDLVIWGMLERDWTP